MNRGQWGECFIINRVRVVTQSFGFLSHILYALTYSFLLALLVWFLFQNTYNWGFLSHFLHFTSEKSLVRKEVSCLSQDTWPGLGLGCRTTEHLFMGTVNPQAYAEIVCRRFGAPSHHPEGTQLHPEMLFSQIKAKKWRNPEEYPLLCLNVLSSAVQCLDTSWTAKWDWCILCLMRFGWEASSLFQMALRCCLTPYW